MVAELKIHLDNEVASQDQLDFFSDIRVDQAIGMAAEAELTVYVDVDETGSWIPMEESFLQATTRVRIEVKIGEEDFVPLIDGQIVGQRFDLSASPGASKLILIVQDDSVLLNKTEAVELYEEQSADEIAQSLFQAAGLNAQTDSVALPAGSVTRYLVRRGTAMQFLRELAKRHGMFIYVEPSEQAGTSIGYFKRPQLENTEYPELLLVGAERNINQFTAQFDGLRPLTARADNVNLSDLQIQSSESETGDITTQGDEAVHDFTDPGQILLSRTQTHQDDLDSAVNAAINYSSWAYSANAEVYADSYNAVLMPYRVVSVAGAGSQLSGDWLISQVTHTISSSTYKQELGLRRNARSSGGSSSGLPGGIF